MNIIKLNAISSTNDYLKELAVSTALPDFTVVVAEYQTKGRGQMGATWVSEPSTNLTFSILLTDAYITITDIYTVNVAIAISIHKVLLKYNLKEVSIKWPNDIMSYNKKIGGILIENIFRSQNSIQSIIGVGINLNQVDFDTLAQASSIFKTYGVKLDKVELLKDIVDEFQKIIKNLANCKEQIWEYYHENLFKKNIPVTFETKNGIKFTGMIKFVNQLGQLGVLNEAEELVFFNLKDVKMLY